jgi:hypothetical protein
MMQGQVPERAVAIELPHDSLSTLAMKGGVTRRNFEQDAIPIGVSDLRHSGV